MPDLHIFIGFREVAGFYTSLQEGFTRLGYQCGFYSRQIHPFKYDLATNNIFQRLFLSISRKRAKNKGRNKLLKLALSFSMKTVSLALFIYSLFHYDVFIFGFKESFAPKCRFLDLPLLKLFGKKLIFVFNGSDARPPYCDGAFLPYPEVTDIEALIRSSAKRKRELKIIEKFADYCIVHPPTAILFEKPCLSFFHLGIPVRLDEKAPPAPEGGHDRVVTVLHCPSHPAAKGTETIRETIKKLSQKHLITYIEVIGKPNSFVREKLQECDFVVDQLYSPTPMPGFVSEAAAFGKPAVICGYYCREIQEMLPEALLPPSYYCHPTELEKAIEKLIIDREFRLELGAKARRFVETQWEPETVARRFLQVIEDDVPEDWLFDPGQVNYIHGACVSENRLRKVLRALVEAGGKKALQVSDKPELERLFVTFSQSE